jgi:hypothetical protein
MRMENHEDNWNRGRHWGPWRIVAVAIAVLIIVPLLVFVFGTLTMLLWNWLMPALFGLKTITFWMAIGILLLGKLIFGCRSGFYRHHGRSRGWGKGHWHRDNDWAPDGDHRNWRYYRQYWREKGKKDFEDYLRGMKQNNGQQEGQGGHQA